MGRCPGRKRQDWRGVQPQGGRRRDRSVFRERRGGGAGWGRPVSYRLPGALEAAPTRECCNARQGALGLRGEHRHAHSLLSVESARFRVGGPIRPWGATLGSGTSTACRRRRSTGRASLCIYARGSPPAAASWCPFTRMATARAGSRAPTATPITREGTPVRSAPTTRKELWSGVLLSRLLFGFGRDVRPRREAPAGGELTRFQAVGRWV